MEDVAPEDLTRTNGSLDYITLREIFVNQAVHQDYRDTSAPGQIEIHPSKITVFNTGYSLVAPEKLLDGGKSQSRNPLIARAFRSIGFAEIAGSGIRAVHRACQQARRRAPTFESDRGANTFALTLDWSEGGSDVDNYWQTLVGVHLTERQTAVLNVVVGAPSVTIRVIETSTGLSTDDIIEALDFLVVQVLVEQDEANYRLAQHLREKLG
jgi:predicted HTH transcriptional regulator